MSITKLIVTFSPSSRGLGRGNHEKANSENHFLYNKELKSKARSLRLNMTKAEACLWKFVLRGCRLGGFQFRRKRPVLNYIADFISKELMLIIVVDGITHSNETISINEDERQREL